MQTISTYMSRLTVEVSRWRPAHPLFDYICDQVETGMPSATLLPFKTQIFSIIKNHNSNIELIALTSEGNLISFYFSRIIVHVGTEQVSRMSFS